MNIKQLKFANAIVKEKSFSLAAKTCFVSQPTLSNSIKALEKEFGRSIFKRTTKKVELSSFGRDILPFIESILNAENALYDHIDKTNKSGDNIIRLGISPLVNSEMIMLIIEAFKSTHNNYEVLINEINLNELQEQLNNELLDIIFVPRIPNQFSENQCDSFFLYNEPLHVIMKDAFPLNDEINLEDIQEKTILMVPNSCGLSIITRSLLESSGQGFKEYEGKAISYHVLANWAYSGLGIALLPKSKIPDSIEQSAKLLQNGNTVDISFDVKWNIPNPITGEFMAFLKEHINNTQKCIT